MAVKSESDRWRILAGGSVLTLHLGSIHAFSVFVAPLEMLYGAPRASVSLVYSSALVCLTLAVLVGHRVYPAFRPHWIAACVCTVAALGLALAAISPAIIWTVLAYGVAFGGANGIGYGFSLYAVSLAWPERKGLAMGLVTAFYAVGAALFAQLFDFGVQLGGAKLALLCMAMWMLAVGLTATVLLRGSALDRAPRETPAESSSRNAPRTLRLLWLGYGTGVAAGLMAIGHAVGILRAAQATPELAVTGVTLIAASNALGGVLAGWLADRLAIRLLLMVLPGVSTVALFLLATSPGAAVALAAISSVGLAYGAIIAVYPAAAAAYYGPDQAPRMYGRIFTAWGTAGLLAPWLAGLLFDVTGGYAVALVSAAAAAILSSIAIALLPAPSTA